MLRVVLRCAAAERLYVHTAAVTVSRAVSTGLGGSWASSGVGDVLPVGVRAVGCAVSPC